MPLIYQHRIHSDDLRNNPTVLYLFGDNEKRSGRKGQAKPCRGHKNAVGIATKRLPSRSETAFWSDDEFERCSAIIDKDFEPVINHIRRGGIVVCPSDGLGTGLSELQERAPKLFQHIRHHIIALKSFKPS